MKAVPIRTIEQFEVVHRTASAQLEKYAGSKRDDYKKLAPCVARDSDWRNARYLNANNIEGRINFANLMLAGIAENTDVCSVPLHFVTIVCRDYVVPIEDAMAMPHRELKMLIYRLCQLTRQALQGLTFVGIVEPALYKDWGAAGPSLGRDHLHWHVHVIVWGHTLEQIKQVTDPFKTSHHRSISDGTPIHIKAITADEISIYVLYMAKAPLKEYRLNVAPGETVDELTGEIFQNHLQQTRDARTGDRVKLANAMKNLNLDDLLFGGIDGRAVARGIVHAALAGVRADERRGVRTG